MDEELRRLLEAVQAKLSRDTAPRDPTVRGLWVAFAEWARYEHPSWVAIRCKMAHVVAYFGERRVSTLTLADVDDYRRARRRQTKKGRAPAPASLNYELIWFSAMFRWCIERKLIGSNPLAGWKKLKVNNVRQTLIREDLLQRLLEKAHPVLWAFLLLANDTGMRRGEIVPLLWEQVDLQRRVISLRQSDTKTDEQRRPRFTRRAKAALEALPRHISNRYVFSKSNGDHYAANTIYGWWRDLLRDTGIIGARGERLRIHDFRRAHVSLAAERGVRRAVIKKQTGHKTDLVFNRYDIAEDNDLDAAIEKFEAGIEPERRPPQRYSPDGSYVAADGNTRATSKPTE